MAKLILFLAAALAGQLFLSGCQKVANTTPRYNKDACLICCPFGNESDAGKCSYCKGTGICQFCKGKGKRLEGKKDAYYETICAFCSGTGKCHYCGGNGKCGVCKGTGKYVPFASTKPENPLPESLSHGGGK